jgi:hypothetical protein
MRKRPMTFYHKEQNVQRMLWRLPVITRELSTPRCMNGTVSAWNTTYKACNARETSMPHAHSDWGSHLSSDIVPLHLNVRDRLHNPRVPLAFHPAQWTTLCWDSGATQWLHETTPFPNRNGSLRTEFGAGIPSIKSLQMVLWAPQTA